MPILGDFLTGGRWPAAWREMEIANGDFQAPGDEIAREPGSPVANIVPGWSHHGGGGGGHIRSDAATPNQYYLELGGGTTGAEDWRAHNSLYVPPNAGYLTFELQTFAGGDGTDFLEVALGENVISADPIPDSFLLDSDRALHTVKVPIDRSLRDQVHVLTLRIVSSSAAAPSRVRIDNLRFERAYEFDGAPGDVILVDLRAESGGTHFEPDFGFDSLAGGTVIMSDEMEGVPFETTGRFFFVPDLGYR